MSDALPPGGTAKALIGVTRLAKGKADGLLRFATTRQALLASLTPWLAFGLVGSVLQAVRGDAGGGVISMLVTVIALLTPMIVSHALARAWGREDAWPLYAVALNWCYWITPFAAAALVVAVWVLLKLGMPTGVAGLLPLLGFAAYLFWLNWFVARGALQVSGWRAAGLVVIVNLVMAAVIMGPGAVMEWLHPMPA